jgi:methionine-rich copper-binding protein CopC
VPIQVFSRWRKSLRSSSAALATVAFAHALAADSNLTAFESENNAAMAKMMAGMNIRSSGDIDRDFATMMIAHHQGAIDMAQAQLRYGKNEQLRRIAQGIIVEQMQEIAAMRMVLGQSLPPGSPAPAQVPAPPQSAKPNANPQITHP